ncbi:MAG: hypothetical protein L3J26_06785 [Candidatus Polarisedimenticolaceae bacterium]|nr:hypothetical protein [Candidatus Polarisedimenticolaceae bacterium]
MKQKTGVIMILDFEKYLPYLDEFDLSQDQKLEFIKTVWQLMESQVDQAFGFHPVQQARESAQVIQLHSLRNIKGLTVSTHFESASQEAANNNEDEVKKKAS